MLIPVILCGGAGSRLWPVSRELHPKPFLRLADGQSLLQKAFVRGALLPEVERIFTVGNRDLFFKTEDEYRAVNGRNLPISYILEPLGRNTGAAVAAAAIHAQRIHGDDVVLLVLAADHLVTDQAAFADAVLQARALAATGSIVTFGIQPTGPETGYGYIEAEGNRVQRFVEKPSLEKAREYLASGRFFWNSGMFCFTAGVMLRELAAHCPDLLDATRLCIGMSDIVGEQGVSQLVLDAGSFAQVPSISIDFAVMEKTKSIAVVACQIGWSDIGSWNAISDLSDADANGNRVHGNALLHDSTGCYVQSNGRMVGVVGVRDLVIVDTPDAVLVASNACSQDVKRIFETLKANGHESHKNHATVQRPWGSFTVLEEGERFKVKRIEVKPGASLSLQMHHRRSEHWTVVGGEAQVVNGDQNLVLKTDQSTYIPAGCKHRLANHGDVDVVMIEVQSGQYLGEDDIVRFQDQYGRV